MTNAEAIKVLVLMRDINLNYFSPDRKNALQLAINSLKREIASGLRENP